LRARNADIVVMQVISAPNSESWADRIAIARSVLVAVLLLAAGAALAWLCLGTQLVSSYTPGGWVTASDTIVGVLVWGFAIVVPASFLLLGIARLASIMDDYESGRTQSVTPQLASALGADHLAATDLVLPGGRRIRELVMGPFGIVVFGEVPPPSISRFVGSRWEVKDTKGRWISIEGPLERATRDAERVRGWLSTDDRDFVVRVYAAVVSDDPRVVRTPACAVVAPSDLALWMGALPFQRGLTPDRRERIASMIREVATRR
jgi:hypothetical protein